MRRRDSTDIFQILPLVLAALLLTAGLAMFLSGTTELIDVIRPAIVVFGGTLAALLASFPLSQLAEALHVATVRGIRGGTDPRAMIRAMLRICDISRRDGLLGVAEIRSNHEEVEDVCHLIGDAASESSIRFSLDRRQTSENAYYRMTTDVFLFAAIYASVIGLLGSLSSVIASPEPGGADAVPVICGLCLAVLMSMLISRLRHAHRREMVVVEIAYRGASIILEDNNLQRLRSRLMLLVPPGLRA